MSYGMQRFETTLRRLLPLDFPDNVPVYVVSRWDLDYPRLADQHGMLAFVRSTLDLYFKPYLQKAGRWQGRGFCTCVYEGEFSKHELGEHHDVALINILIHEAAHWCAWEPPSDVPTGNHAAVIEEQIASIVDNTSAIDREAQKGEPHGPDFIRAALHLMTRAQRAGLLTSPQLMSIHYGEWSDPGEYLHALNGEPERRLNEPLRNVLADPPPRLFSALAAYDRARLGTPEAGPAPPCGILRRGVGRRAVLSWRNFRR